jgi:hypothetical protein
MGLTQRRRLVKLLFAGPLAFGYRTNRWTTTRIAEVIQAEFGVRYHRAHVGRLMHRLNWSHQKLERRVLERDQKAIDGWKQKDWPGVKKRCAAGRPYRIRRYIGLPVDPHRGQDLGSRRPNSRPW